MPKGMTPTLEARTWCIHRLNPIGDYKKHHYYWMRVLELSGRGDLTLDCPNCGPIHVTPYPAMKLRVRAKE